MQKNISDQSNELCQENSFFGGVIYIDLRNYSKIVEKKPLQNIATIVYEYQDAITEKIKKSFSDEEVLTFEYMGDGVLIIFKDVNAIHLDNPNVTLTFALKLYKNTKVLKDIIEKLLNEKKEDFHSLQDLDFGIGVSCSEIYQQTYYNYENTKKREIFFGKCLNRAAKIGDKMNKDKGNIAIDKNMYNEFIVDSLDFNEKQNMIEKKKPIVHMHKKGQKTTLQNKTE